MMLWGLKRLNQFTNHINSYLSIRPTVKEANSPISPVDSFPLAVVLGDNGAQALNHVLCTKIDIFTACPAHEAIAREVRLETRQFSFRGGLTDAKYVFL